MPQVMIKGHTINAIPAKDSYNRRAVQYRNNLITSLEVLGLTVDDVDIELERIAIKNAPASCTWYMDGYRLYYSYNGTTKFVDNLFVVWKVIAAEIQLLLNQKKTFDEFCNEFIEDKNIEHMRKEARELLGVEHDSVDFELIHRNYKQLAKKHHPDMGGDLERFKRINNAHKMLKRELM